MSGLVYLLINETMVYDRSAFINAQGKIVVPDKGDLIMLDNHICDRRLLAK